MKTFGLYGGNVLRVDLSTGSVKVEPLDTDVAEKYIGGWGMNARLGYDLIKPGMDAYAPEMPVIFGAGVLNGTPCPSSPKSFVTTKDKASGTVVTAVGSLLLGANLKWAGFDHVVIQGKADKPVYLKVDDGGAEICDGSALWGLDIFETTRELKQKYGNRASVISIGPASEKEVPISMMFNETFSTLGRSFGTNLGFRKLKAIVVTGNGGVKLADRTRFMKTVNELAEKAIKDPLREKWAGEGLYFVFPLWAKAGYFSSDNFREGYPESEAYRVYGAQHFNRVRKRSIACPSCITPDKYLCVFEDAEQPGFEMLIGTPIDPAMSFGIRNEVDDFDKAWWLFRECNRVGLDAMTLSALIGFAADLYGKGVITSKDTDGIEIKPGFETARKLLDLTARKEGFGAILGEGFEGMIKRFDHLEEACQIKGTEPDFDGRASLGVEVFGAVTNPRGAHDMPVGGLTVAKGRKPDFFKKVVSKIGYVPEEALPRVFEEDGFNVGCLTAHYENWATVLNCLGVCFRMQSSSLYDLKVAAELYSAGTGIERSPQQLLENAERAYNLYKMLNVREGFNRKDDRFPDRWFEPLKMTDKDDMVLQDYFGRKKLERKDIERLLDDYYKEKGWDPGKGTPTKKKLSELGLSDEYGA